MTNAEKPATVTGGCLCGAVRYTVRGPLRDIIACHCEQCRRTSGHHVAATNARRADVDIADDGSLAWYESSTTARRGFCRVCGASLFWERRDGKTISIMAGTLDAPTGLRLSEHIFTDFAGDYYRLDDDLPKRRTYE